jgi:hypothetical protein
MKRKSLFLAITSIAIVAVIIALAINTHLKLSALEPEGHEDESAEEVLNEIITGKPSHSETTTEKEEGLNHNENIETSHAE